MDLCGKLGGFADFENTVDGGSAVTILGEINSGIHMYQFTLNFYTSVFAIRLWFRVRKTKILAD